MRRHSPLKFYLPLVILFGGAFLALSFFAYYAKQTAAVSQYTNESAGYSFQVPDGWIASSSTENEFKANFGPAENPELGSVSVDGHALSIDSFVDNSIGSAQEKIPGFKPVFRRSAQVGGQPALRLRIAFDSYNGEGVYVMRDTIVYSIGISSIQAQDLSRLDQLLNTFAFSVERPQIWGFPDLGSDHPNFQAIIYVQQQGIVSGYSDRTYRPNNLITRAEFTKIFLSTFIDATTLAACVKENIGLADIDLTTWVAPYVCVAKERGIIKGYPDGTFRPDKNVSLAEAAKIVVGAILASTEKEVVPSEPWPKAYLDSLASIGVIPPTIKNYNSPITRGEMAEMIYRLQLEITTLPTKTYEALKP